MKKLILGLIIPFTVSASGLDEVKKKINEKLPKTKVEEVRESEIKGLYEVMLENGEIIYTDGNYLVFGHIFTFDGQDITETKKGVSIQKVLSKLDKDKLLKIGKGSKEIIEITDPECPFCKKAEKFFEESSNVSRYVIFYPLPFHKNAKRLSVHIMCSKDKEKAYKEIMNGNFNEKSLLKCEEGEKLVSEMEDIAKNLGIRGTPTFFIKTENGYKKIEGASPEIIEYLK